MKKPNNVITVYGIHSDNTAGAVSYLNCSMTLDAADHSIRIERKAETVAHYDRDEYLRVVQEIS